MEKLTRKIMLDRLQKADFKTAAARELMRHLIEFHEDFVHRNRQEYFRGIALTIGQVFTEDNPTIQRLLLRPNPEKQAETLPASRLMRGRLDTQRAKQQAREPGDLRVFRMSELSKYKEVDHTVESLLEAYPTMPELREYARKYDYVLPSNMQNVEKAAGRIIRHIQRQKQGAPDTL